MITQTSEYALRAVVHLAEAGGGPATTQEISEATRVPLGYLHKILRMLARAGLLRAQRGVGGGFSLTRAASSISVLDVLGATDGAPVRIERCPLGIEGHTTLCPMHRMLDEAVAHLESVFARTTIAQLAAAGRGDGGLCAE